MKSILVLAAVLSLLLAPGCSSKNTTDPNSSRTVISGKIEGGDQTLKFLFWTMLVQN